MILYYNQCCWRRYPLCRVTSYTDDKKISWSQHSQNLQEFKGQYPDENSVEFDEFDENNELGDSIMTTTSSMIFVNRK